MGNPKQVDFGGSDIVTNNVRIGVTKAGGATSAAPAILTGTGAPTGISAPKGSLYINKGGTGAADRIYINSSATVGTTWTNLTAAA